MTAAIMFAFASATFLGAGVVTTQLGLRTVEPLSGAAISVPTFTLLFLLASPFILAGEPVVWRGLPIFIAIGLFFPASLTFLTFASNRALGPVITSTLGNLAPLFSVALAVALLHEPLRGASVDRPCHRGCGRRHHQRHAAARSRPLAKPCAAAAAGERADPRRGAADRQARARGMAEPARGPA